MAVIGWGKPRIFIREYKAGSENTAEWKELNTPVEDSTQLTTTKGTKVEAKIEGGENEDVKYGKNTYALVFNIRAAKGRKKPIEDSDGIITKNYELMLQPEDPQIDGIWIEKATVSVEDTWTAADGGVWIYTFDALKTDRTDNTKGSLDQVKWGIVTAQGAMGTLTDVTFVESVAE